MPFGTVIARLNACRCSAQATLRSHPGKAGRAGYLTTSSPIRQLLQVDIDCATYFTEASLLPAEAYLCSEAYTQEAYIDLESQYCSDEDADKQDLQYRLLVGGLRSSRKAPSSRLGSRKHSGTQAKLIRKPCKTRYAFEIADPSRAAKRPEARQTSAGTNFHLQACVCTAHWVT